MAVPQCSVAPVVGGCAPVPGSCAPVPGGCALVPLLGGCAPVRVPVVVTLTQRCLCYVAVVRVPVSVLFQRQLHRPRRGLSAWFVRPRAAPTWWPRAAPANGLVPPLPTASGLPRRRPRAALSAAERGSVGSSHGAARLARTSLAQHVMLLQDRSGGGLAAKRFQDSCAPQAPDPWGH